MLDAQWARGTDRTTAPDRIAGWLASGLIAATISLVACSGGGDFDNSPGSTGSIRGVVVSSTTDASQVNEERIARATLSALQTELTAAQLSAEMALGDSLGCLDVCTLLAQALAEPSHRGGHRPGLASARVRG